MTNQEIKNLTFEQLLEKTEESKRSLQKLRFAHAVTPIENPMVIRNQRRLVARLLTEVTVKQQQELAQESK